VLSLRVAPNGVVWFDGEHGMTRFNQVSWTRFSGNDGLQAGFIPIVYPDLAGGVWFGITGAGEDWAFGNGNL
jgi:hypothetical protein